MQHQLPFTWLASLGDNVRADDDDHVVDEYLPVSQNANFFPVNDHWNIGNDRTQLIDL